MSPTRLVVRLLTLVTAGLLLVVSALVDLRSPEGTAAFGERLAEADAVRTLVSLGLVDAVLDDAAVSAPAAAPLLPAVRPLLQTAVERSVDSDAGRTALATALTDTVRQLTFDGPVAIDLRGAVLAAADAAPEPLDTLARSAVERDVVGTVVLGGDGDTTADLEPPSPDALTTLAGLPSSAVLALAGGLLVLVLAGSVVPPGPSRGWRMRAAGGALLLVAVPALLLLRVAPDVALEPLTARITELAPDGAVAAGTVGEVLDAVLDGLSVLLARTGDLVVLLSVAGLVLVVLGFVVRGGARDWARRGAD